MSAVAARSTSESAPAQRASVSGKWLADVAQPGGTEQRVGDGVGDARRHRCDPRAHARRRTGTRRAPTPAPGSSLKRCTSNPCPTRITRRSIPFSEHSVAHSRSSGSVILRLLTSPGTTTTRPPIASTSEASSVPSRAFGVRLAQHVGRGTPAASAPRPASPGPGWRRRRRRRRRRLIVSVTGTPGTAPSAPSRTASITAANSSVRRRTAGPRRARTRSSASSGHRGQAGAHAVAPRLAAGDATLGSALGGRHDHHDAVADRLARRRRARSMTRPVTEPLDTASAPPNRWPDRRRRPRSPTPARRASHGGEGSTVICDMAHEAPRASRSHRLLRRRVHTDVLLDGRRRQR